MILSAPTATAAPPPVLHVPPPSYHAPIYSYQIPQFAYQPSGAYFYQTPPPSSVPPTQMGFPPNTAPYPPPFTYTTTAATAHTEYFQSVSALAAPPPAAAIDGTAVHSHGMSPSLTSGFSGSGADCKSTETSSILSAGSYSSLSNKGNTNCYAITTNGHHEYAVPHVAVASAAVHASTPIQVMAANVTTAPPLYPNEKSNVKSIKPAPRPLMASTIIMSNDMSINGAGRYHNSYYGHPSSSAAAAAAAQHHYRKTRSMQAAVHHQSSSYHSHRHQNSSHHRSGKVEHHHNLANGNANASSSSSASSSTYHLMKQDHEQNGGGRGGHKHHQQAAAMHHHQQQPNGGVIRNSGSGGNTNGNSSSTTSEISCEVCHVSVNSSHQLQAHLAGKASFLVDRHGLEAVTCISLRILNEAEIIHSHVHRKW